MPRNPWTVASVTVPRRSRRKAASSICVPRAERNTSPVLPHPGPFFCRDRVPATGAGLPATGSTAAPRGPACSDTKCSPKWAAEHAPVTPLPDNGIALLPHRARAFASTATAASASGTRCASPLFIRAVGMVHVAWSRSISLHRAPSTSEVRVAVRTRKRSAIPAPRRLACAAVSILATTCATSPTATDSRCFVLCPEWGRMASMAPLAGLSVRCPCAMHQSNTSRIRWRTLRAVGALPARSSAATMPTTSSHTIASTGRSAIGAACARQSWTPGAGQGS